MLNKIITVLVGLATSTFVSAQADDYLPVPTVDFSPYMRTIFTPTSSGTEEYLDWVRRNCRESLRVADYTFTNQEIADLYCELARQGVDVRVILDKQQSRSVKSEKALIQQMRKAGVVVLVTSSSEKSAIMHCKFTVADERHVQDGSWNYTRTADLQDNHMNFTLSPSPDRARLFLAKWDQMHETALEQARRSRGRRK